MEFIIYFVGLIMIVQGEDIGGQAGTYHALIPEWNQNQTVCGMEVPRHAAYIRVRNRDIVSETGWPASEKTACADPTLKCSLYEIAAASTLSVHPGFTPVSGVKMDPANFCALPQLEATAALGKKPKVDAGSKARTIADMAIPGGTLGTWAFQATPDSMIYTTWTVTPPGAPTNSQITLKASARNSSTVRTLVLKAKSPIFVINIPPVFAGVALNTPNPTMDHHHVLYETILQSGSGDCNLPKPTCLPRVRPGTTLNLGCSNTGCCRK